MKNGEDIISEGILDNKSYDIGRTGCGAVSIDLSTITDAAKLTFEVEAAPGIRNSWSVWVYPPVSEVKSESIVMTADPEEAKRSLKAGRKVLLSPDKSRVKGEESHFVPVFWSPVHFPKQAGCMGIYAHKEHAALKDFPTDIHTDWQWWSLLKNAVNVDLEGVGEVCPIVEVVDNFTTNRQLGLIFEAKAGEGSLLFSSIDLLNADDPASRQLLRSLVRYMESDDFAPTKSIDFDKHILNVVCF